MVPSRRQFVNAVAGKANHQMAITGNTLNNFNLDGSFSEVRSLGRTCRST